MVMVMAAPFSVCEKYIKLPECAFRSMSNTKTFKSALIFYCTACAWMARYFQSWFLTHTLLFCSIDVVSSLVFNLEDNLPDELVHSANWADNIGSNKSTGPSGNSQQQMNGEDPTGVPNVAWNQHQRPGEIFCTDTFQKESITNEYFKF